MPEKPNSVSLESIEAKIAQERYLRVPNTTLTICILTMINGFHVVAHSACVDPANFDVQMGEQIARKKAVDQLWALEGYMLAETRVDDL